MTRIVPDPLKVIVPLALTVDSARRRVHVGDPTAHDPVLLSVKSVTTIEDCACTEVSHVDCRTASMRIGRIKIARFTGINASMCAVVESPRDGRQSHHALYPS